MVNLMWISLSISGTLPLFEYLLESSIFIWGLLRRMGSGDILADERVGVSEGSGVRKPSSWGVSAPLPFSL